MQEFFKMVKPEDVGLQIKNVKKFYEKIEEIGLTTHSVLMLRGNSIFT